MFQNDYILREIEGLTRFLAKTLLRKDIERGEVIDEKNLVSGDGFFKGQPIGLTWHTLLQMLSDGAINEAENLLHERIEEDPRPEYLEIAVRFYTRLNEMIDEELESHNFSREEIADGLEAVKQYYVVM